MMIFLFIVVTFRSQYDIHIVSYNTFSYALYIQNQIESHPGRESMRGSGLNYLPNKRTSHHRRRGVIPALHGCLSVRRIFGMHIYEDGDDDDSNCKLTFAHTAHCHWGVSSYIFMLQHYILLKSFMYQTKKRKTVRLCAWTRITAFITPWRKWTPLVSTQDVKAEILVGQKRVFFRLSVSMTSFVRS